MPKGKRKNDGPPFVMLERSLLNGEAWKQLTLHEMIVYIYLKKNYNGHNNGNISLKYKELHEIGIKSRATISKSFKGLEEKGWIRQTQPGGLFQCPSLYEITWNYDRDRQSN